MLTLLALSLTQTFACINDGQSTHPACQVIMDQQNAWNGGDLDGFMQGYWNSDALSFISGADITKGWQAINARYKARYDGENQTMGDLQFAGLEITPLSAEAVYITGVWSLQTGEELFDGRFTLIMRQTDEGWRVVHDHTSN